MLEEFARYLLRQGKCENTASAYLKNVEEYVRWFENVKQDKILIISIDELKKYRAYLEEQKKYHSKTVDVKVTSVMRFSEFLHKNNFNVSRGIEIEHLRRGLNLKQKRKKQQYNYLTGTYITLA